MMPQAPLRDVSVADFPNEVIAALVDQVAALLEVQGASSARVAAYRRAASAIRAHALPVDDLLAAEGAIALAKVVGHRLAGTIAEIAATGRLAFLDTLRGEVEPGSLAGAEFGMGSRLARRVHEALGIVTIAELEIAARDGRLANVRGFGGRRVEAIHDRLASRLGRRVRGCQAITPVVRVRVDEMLEVDRQYWQELAAGHLPRITPRDGERGSRVPLPILHAARGERQYTATAAGSGPAHELGTTTDWVVVYVEDRLGTRQAMVVTETTGALTGQRVVRGRERDDQATNGCPRRRAYAVR